MSFTEAWKATVAAELKERGARSDLARWLSAHAGGEFNARKVQIARIFGTDAIPEAEFVLAVESWRKKPTDGRNRAKQKSRR